jgi:hypothetical protein
MIYLKKFVQKILFGILDGILPNIKESIKLEHSEFIEDKPAYKIDYVRLATSLITFGLILASIFGWIDIKQVIFILEKWNFQ